MKNIELLEALVDSFLAAAADASSDVTHLCILIMHRTEVALPCNGSSPTYFNPLALVQHLCFRARRKITMSGQSPQGKGPSTHTMSPVRMSSLQACAVLTQLSINNGNPLFSTDEYKDSAESAAAS
jgi:hypothetical protein